MSDHQIVDPEKVKKAEKKVVKTETAGPKPGQKKVPKKPPKKVEDTSDPKVLVDGKVFNVKKLDNIKSFEKKAKEIETKKKTEEAIENGIKFGDFGTADIKSRVMASNKFRYSKNPQLYFGVTTLIKAQEEKFEEKWRVEDFEYSNLRDSEKKSLLKSLIKPLEDGQITKEQYAAKVDEFDNETRETMKDRVKVRKKAMDTATEKIISMNEDQLIKLGKQVLEQNGLNAETKEIHEEYVAASFQMKSKKRREENTYSARKKSGRNKMSRYERMEEDNEAALEFFRAGDQMEEYMKLKEDYATRVSQLEQDEQSLAAAKDAMKLEEEQVQQEEEQLDFDVPVGDDKPQKKVKKTTQEAPQLTRKGFSLDGDDEPVVPVTGKKEDTPPPQVKKEDVPPPGIKKEEEDPTKKKEEEDPTKKKEEDEAAKKKKEDKEEDHQDEEQKTKTLKGDKTDEKIKKMNPDELAREIKKQHDVVLNIIGGNKEKKEKISWKTMRSRANILLKCADLYFASAANAETKTVHSGVNGVKEAVGLVIKLDLWNRGITDKLEIMSDIDAFAAFADGFVFGESKPEMGKKDEEDPEKKKKKDEEEHKKEEPEKKIPKKEDDDTNDPKNDPLKKPPVKIETDTKPPVK